MILITGGAGYVGSYLVDYLLRRKYKIKVLDSFIFGKESLKNFKNRIEIITGDVRNPPKKVFRNVATIVHLAGFSNDPTANFDPQLNYETNTVGTLKLAQEAKKQGVKRFIFASSCSIYDHGLTSGTKTYSELSPVHPKAPYSSSKYKAEIELLKLTTNSFETVIVRKGTIYGWSERMRFDLVVNTMLRDALTSSLINVYCNGLQWRPLISLADTAQAYQNLIAAPSSRVRGQTINVVAFNSTIKDLALKVKMILSPITKVKVNIQPMMKESRSYRVANNKYRKLFPQHKFTPLEKTIPEMVAKINSLEKSPAWKTDPKYYNIEWFKLHYQFHEKKKYSKAGHRSTNLR